MKFKSLVNLPFHLTKGKVYDSVWSGEDILLILRTDSNVRHYFNKGLFKSVPDESEIIRNEPTPDTVYMWKQNLKNIQRYYYGAPVSEAMVELEYEGDYYTVHVGSVTKLTHYDEDPESLICRDIEFKEGDYFDLRKHTPEQIRHIAEYYKFWDVDDSLNGLWVFVGMLQGEFVGIGKTATHLATGKEHHYNDLFYEEGM